MASTTTSGLNYISDILNLPASIDLLEDVDFENSMLVLDNSPRSPRRASASPTLRPHRHHASAAHSEHLEPLDLSLTSLGDLFPPVDEDQLVLLNDQPTPRGSIAAMSPSTNAAINNLLSPDVKLRVNVRSSLPGQSGGVPELSPSMDSFLRESWEDIEKTPRHASLKTLFEPATSPYSSAAAITPLPGNFVLPVPVHHVGQATIPASIAMPLPLPSRSSTFSSSTSSTKAPRKAKQCIVDGCIRRAQSNNRCKTHGGGARCQVEGCDKSSQGGGLCRAHGGGKKCRVPGCTKGTQRLGLCYLHGGIRRCITEGCKKKDRGNGYCISHGGGRRCEVPGCNRSVRKGNHCQTHQGAPSTSSIKPTRTVSDGVMLDESPFKISRHDALLRSTSAFS